MVDQGGPMSDGVEKIAQRRRIISESMGGRLEGNCEHKIRELRRRRLVENWRRTKPNTKGYFETGN